MKMLKNIQIALLLSFGLSIAAFAQVPAPTTLPVPGAADSFVFTNAAGHSVPYQLFFSQNGIIYAVFDPSVLPADFIATVAYLQSSYATAQSNGAKIIPIVCSAELSTNFLVQESRVQVPFVVSNSTTLQTIPFSQPISVQVGGHYRFSASLYINAGTGGTKIDVGGTCNTSNFVANYSAVAGTTGLYGGQLTSFLSGPAGSSTTATTKIVIDGEMDVTNGGTFVIQFTQNASNATPSVVLAGSVLTVTQIP